MDDEFRIKRKKPLDVEQGPSAEKEAQHSAEDVAVRRLRSKLVTFEFDIERICQEILEQCASNPATYSALYAIVNLARKEL